MKRKLYTPDNDKGEVCEGCGRMMYEFCRLESSFATRPSDTILGYCRGCAARILDDKMLKKANETTET